ncbi:MAG TPA: TIGR01457 family HAD-type hydrolase [Polyangia bacterium]|nr:TIGR01457 family HAD-type hydrolase [Polyangia bacterium]
MKEYKQMFEGPTGFLIDMDGVIYRGKRAIPGAAKFIGHLQRFQIPFRFLTNNSQRSRRDVCVRLARMGIPIQEDKVFTCAIATARFLARQKPKGTAYVIGEGGLLTALHHNGFAIDDQRPDYVIVGEGKTLNMEMLDRAVTLINNGARLVATNLDPNCPTESGMRAGCGAIVSILEAATGRKALGIGKPSPITVQEAARELGTAPSRTVMIGDTMETDILGGVQLGFQTVLVLSGATKKEHLDQFAYQPTYVVKSVQDLLDHPLVLDAFAELPRERWTA